MVRFGGGARRSEGGDNIIDFLELFFLQDLEESVTSRGFVEDQHIATFGFY